MQVAKSQIYQVEIAGQDFGRIATCESREIALSIAQHLAETDGINVRKTEIKLRAVREIEPVYIERIPNRLRDLAEIDPKEIKRMRSDRETPTCVFPDMLIGDHGKSGKPELEYPRCPNPAQPGRTTCNLHHSLGRAGRPTPELYLAELATMDDDADETAPKPKKRRTATRTRKTAPKPAGRRAAGRRKPKTGDA